MACIFDFSSNAFEPFLSYNCCISICSLNSFVYQDKRKIIIFAGLFTTIQISEVKHLCKLNAQNQ